MANDPRTGGNTEMPPPIYVIYHHECRDGFGAAWAAYKVLGHLTNSGNPVHYIPSKYGHRPPETDPDGCVYILDFSYNLETMNELFHRHSGRLTLLDHHKTAMDELQGEVPGCHFDMNRSGAVLAWNFFHPLKTLPPLLAYVQDRDLWQWKLPSSRQINAALQVSTLDFEVWSHLDLETLALQGEALLELVDRQVAEAVETAVVLEIAGIPVPAVKTQEYVSETAERLLAINPDAPFVVIYHESTDEDGNPVIKHSLRSTNGRADVSAVAQEPGRRRPRQRRRVRKPTKTNRAETHSIQQHSEPGAHMPPPQDNITSRHDGGDPPAGTGAGTDPGLLPPGARHPGPEPTGGQRRRDQPQPPQSLSGHLRPRRTRPRHAAGQD